MTDLPTRFVDGLKDRYTLLREIGAGGMATVYLAEDLRHGRRVAIKVFRPEVASADGTGRFVREISVAARLSHPGILSLHDSGEVDSIPYYVMPYVEGESLGARIQREGRLAIPEALRIARDVAYALQHAHDQGVVHRDIKPDNILLAGEQTLIADFGIAYAVEAIGSERLTATGLVVGTPSFMSPEQITGKGPLDGRADIYSLGGVLYSMLVGEPPFTGTSVQAILARHLAEPVPSIRVVRSTVPRAVEAVVDQALAKDPVDRFASAEAFARALEQEGGSESSLSRILRTPEPRRWDHRWLGWAAVAFATMALGSWLLAPTPTVPRVDRQVLAVLPFTQTGVLPPEVTRVGDQLAEMVVQRLPGDGGPRGIAVAQASDLLASGAERVFLGQLSMLGPALVLAGEIRDVRTDSLIARVEGIRASADSLPMFVDRLVAATLVAELQLPPSRRAALGTLPLPSLRNYRAAVLAFSRGRFGDAMAGLEAVLAVDSTCFPAALLLGAIQMVILDPPASREPLRLAATQFHRMSAADTLELRALRLEYGDYSGTPLDARSRLSRLDGLAQYVGTTEQWYVLGERLFHDGPFLGLPDLLRQAGASFERVLVRDPEFVPAIGHLIDLAAADDDTATVALLAKRYFALDSIGDLSDYYRWRVAQAMGHEDALVRFRRQMDEFSEASLERIVNVAQLDGASIEDAVLAARALWSRSGGSNQARWAMVKQAELALNRGRPSEAAAIVARWQSTGARFRARDGMAEVVNTVFWGADTTAAAAWVAEQRATQGYLNPPIAGDEVSEEGFAICGVSLWIGLRGSGQIDRDQIPLRPARYQQAAGRTELPLCAAILDAWVAHRNRDPESAAKLAFLDSLVSSAPTAVTWLITAANITASQLWEAAGDTDRALAAIRRRVYITDIYEKRVLVGLSTMLREEGRLAALVGDTTGAVTALRRYLALRSDPEPSVAAEVAAARGTLGRLQGR